MEHSFCYLWCQRSFVYPINKINNWTPWYTKNVSSPLRHPCWEKEHARKTGPRQNSASGTAWVLVRVSSAMLKPHDQTQAGEERVCLAYTSTCGPSLKKSGQELKQGWNLEAGADAEAMAGCCLLACSDCFLIEPRTTSLGMAPLTQWAGPINHKLR